MKKLKNILILTTILLASSCTDKDVIETPDINNNIPLSKYALSCTDIFKLSDNTRSANTLSQFEYLTYKGDTVLYLLHKGNGFELYPSDQRFAPVIAFNEHEDLNLDSICPAQAEWIGQLKENIYNFRHFDSTTVNANIAEWNLALKIPQATETRFERDEREGERNSGGWIFHNVRAEYNYLTEINHLISTQFSQKNEYSSYCPFRNDGSGEHYYAGCAPVASAQLIYYLHNKYGWAKKTAGNAIYSARFNQYLFYDWSESAWEEDSCIYKMIGYLGEIEGVTYANLESTTNELGIQTGLHYYGINSFLSKWDSKTIVDNIKNGMPVLAGLHKKDKTTGHVILIDGLKSFQKRYYNVYIYIDDINNYPGDIYDHFCEDDDAGGDPYPEEGPTRVEYIGTGDPQLYFLINWGNGKRDMTYYHESCTLSDKKNIYDGQYNIIYNFQNINNNNYEETIITIPNPNGDDFFFVQQ